MGPAAAAVRPCGRRQRGVGNTRDWIYENPYDGADAVYPHPCAATDWRLTATPATWCSSIRRRAIRSRGRYGCTRLDSGYSARRETTPDGGAALRLPCRRTTATWPSGWTKIAAKLPAAVDISRHRRLGLWVKANGSGGILNVQLTGTDARRDHYVPLTFTGWRYVELETPEDARFWDYSWPGSWTDLFYTDWSIYNATREVDLYFNGLPARSRPIAWSAVLKRCGNCRDRCGRQPSWWKMRSMTFPATLQPDEYVELDFAGRLRHFDPNGKVLAELTPSGRISLQTGPNCLRLNCVAEGECTTCAEVTLSVRARHSPKHDAPAWLSRQIAILPSPHLREPWEKALQPQANQACSVANCRAERNGNKESGDN